MAAVAKAEDVTETDGGGRIMLNPRAIKDQNSVRRTLFCKAPAGATRDDVRYPSFWSKVSSHLSRHDIVFVLADDETWELECRVESVKAGGAEVTITKNIARTGVVQAETQLGPDFHTQWKPGKGWCVIRRSDGVPIITGYAVEAAAILEWQRQQPKVV